MVKIVHMSDTHLGYRARRGTTNKWAIENYSKPYEQEIYDCFLKIMNKISKIKNLDYLVHCGDIFHHPSKYSSYPPPEPARRTLKQGLQIFFENTNNQVPLIYIEGNHGIFRGYEYTPFESHIDKDQYPNLYYFKERDLLEAIKSNEPLSLEFPNKKVRFYLFPYFEFKSFETYKSAYDNWIQNQQPKDNIYINIAVAHGSVGDETLHSKVNSDDFNYDYVALGHEHGFKKVSRNHYYSGGLLPLNFKEIFENQAYLIVDIDEKTKELKVESFFTDNLLNRSFEIILIDAKANFSITELENHIENELKNYGSKDGFNPKTSARLKLNFEGEMTFERNWQINELMLKIRRGIFSQPEKYNILQLIWKISDISETREDDISAGVIQDYILEKPDEEFKTFVNEKLSEEKTEYNVDKLTEFGMKAIKKALRIMEKEKEV
ncbi:MAG: metallophosphoesterase [Candidatus Lokiarchaeota archaeon]|nr:metallophosphoesterase [Candidatus Lokiarchaeota archaeon]